MDDLTASVEAAGVRLCFTLPAGSYAMVLPREINKSDSLDRAAQEESAPDVQELVQLRSA